MTVTETPLAIRAPDVQPLLTDSRSLIIEASAIVVRDIGDHERAEKLIIALKRTIKVLHEGDAEAGGKFPGLDLHCYLTQKAWKAATALRAASIDPYEAAVKIVTRKAVDYEQAAARKAEEEARKLQEQARKAEEDRKLADAEAAPSPQEADAILNEPIVTPMVHVAPAVAKIAGVSTRDNWKGEGFDLMATVKFVATRPEYAYLLSYSATGLTSIARSQRTNCTVPGVKVYNEPTKAVRA